MQRITSYFSLNLSLIVLSVGCYWLALFFHGQYAKAHGAVSQAFSAGVSSAGLANPETYFMRAELAFVASVLVCIFAIGLAIRRKHWASWLAALVVVLITLAIPMFVLWRA